MTWIVIEECDDDGEAVGRIIPRYLPDGITLDDMKKRGDGDGSG